jgi:hypothetical protein
MDERRRGLGALAGGFVLAAAALAAYSRTLQVPLLLDDTPSIAANPTIRTLSGALNPPLGMTVSGRPVLNLSWRPTMLPAGTRSGATTP